MNHNLTSLFQKCSLVSATQGDSTYTDTHTHHTHRERERHTHTHVTPFAVIHNHVTSLRSTWSYLTLPATCRTTSHWWEHWLRCRNSNNMHHMLVIFGRGLSNSVWPPVWGSTMYIAKVLHQVIDPINKPPALATRCQPYSPPGWRVCCLQLVQSVQVSPQPETDWFYDSRTGWTMLMSLQEKMVQFREQLSSHHLCISPSAYC